MFSIKQILVKDFFWWKFSKKCLFNELYEISRKYGRKLDPRGIPKQSELKQKNEIPTIEPQWLYTFHSVFAPHNPITANAITLVIFSLVRTAKDR